METETDFAAMGFEGETAEEDAAPVPATEDSWYVERFSDLVRQILS